MKKTSLILALLALGTVAGPVLAQQSPWLVRLRAVNIDTANKFDATAPGAGLGLSDNVNVSNKTIPEVDISYFFTPNLAAELILTYPQKHDVTVGGKNAGTFKHLPPTLLLQYHFMPEAQFSPYVGAGLNYTRVSQIDLSGPAAGTTLEKNSYGLALQAGVDYKLDKNWSLNLDVKKVQIRSDLSHPTLGKLGTVKIDPWLVGVGVGYRF